MQYYRWGQITGGLYQEQELGCGAGLGSEGRVLVGTKEWVVKTRMPLQTRGSGTEWALITRLEIERRLERSTSSWEFH